jgi:nicotinamide-nucleotide amidase
MAENVNALAKAVLDICQRHGIKLATAESCTGGLISATITAIPGASSVMEHGFVTYTNEAKHYLLGVPLALFETVGAVSEEVACAMAEGAIYHSRTQVSISVTGIAGPGGGTDDKPVGLVHMAAVRLDGETQHERHVFSGDRDAVRAKAVDAALSLVLKVLEN